MRHGYPIRAGLRQRVLLSTASEAWDTLHDMASLLLMGRDGASK